MVSLMVSLCFAQDPIPSQFSMNAALLNPAYTGQGVQGISAKGMFRNQWTFAGLPYRSNGLSIAHSGKRIGIGVNMIQETSGPANLNNLSIGLSLAWQWRFKQTDVRLGWQAGITQKSINAAALTFDNQYVNESGFNPDISHNEFLPNTSIQVADIATGLSLTHHFGTERVLEKLQLGLGVGHASQPSFSFMGSDAVLPRRYTMDATIWTQPTGGRNWIGRILWAKQGDATQTHLQAGLHQQIDPSMAVEVGLGHRLQDALIPYLHIELDNWNLGVSYDFTVSGLRSTTQFRGGLELQLHYHFNKKNKLTPKPEPIIAVVENTVINTPLATQAPLLEDQDGDGLADAIDHCPLCAGTVENHGCPEQAAASPCNCDTPVEKKSQEQFPTIPHVLFETNLSKIESKYKEALDELSVYLVTNSKVGVQVSGHTDIEGNNTYNYTLGESRAQAIKAYLMERGVLPYRINIVSFGETQPVAQNQSSEGRMQNRRAVCLLFQMQEK